MVDIRFGDLRIGSVSGSSGIFSGNNKLHRYKHISKQNQSFGTVDGKGTIVSAHRAVLRDNDDKDSDFGVNRIKPR